MFSLAKLSKLNRYSAHRIALIRNLVFSLFKHGYIFTTHERAKSIRSATDKLINKAKKNNLHNDRQILSFFRQNKEALKNVKDCLNFIDKKKNSGYISIKRVSNRKGDGATLSCARILPKEQNSDTK